MPPEPGFARREAHNPAYTLASTLFTSEHGNNGSPVAESAGARVCDC